MCSEQAESGVRRKRSAVSPRTRRMIAGLAAAVFLLSPLVIAASADATPPPAEEEPAAVETDPHWQYSPGWDYTTPPVLLVPTV